MDLNHSSFFDEKSQKKYFNSRAYKLNSFGYTAKDIEAANLQLAFLKQNSEYNKLFDIYRSKRGSVKAFYSIANKFNLNKTFQEETILYNVTTKDLMKLLNPKVEIDQIGSKILIELLPLLFLGKGVKEIFRAKKIARFGERVGDAWKTLQPSERMIVLDLKKRKRQLIKQLESYIDREIELNKAVKKVWDIDEPISYLLWSQENDRYREEAWQQLQIWKLRKEYKGYNEISYKLNLSTDKVKKGFYKAFERIYGSKYSAKEWKAYSIEHLENKIKNSPDKASDEEWELLRRYERKGQTEHQLPVKRNRSGETISPDPIEGVSDSSRDAVQEDPIARLLLGDIETEYCRECPNESCKKDFYIFIKEKKPQRWDPCPEVISFIRPW